MLLGMLFFFDMDDLSRQGTDVHLALTRSCHSLIIYWHLYHTKLKFCGFFLQFRYYALFYKVGLPAHAQTSFSNWLRVAFGGSFSYKISDLIFLLNVLVSKASFDKKCIVLSNNVLGIVWFWL